MDIRINDLITEKAEYILNHEEITPFAHIVRKPSHFDDTFDIDLNLNGISISSSVMSFELPSNTIIFLDIPSDTYHKIEVM